MLWHQPTRLCVRIIDNFEAGVCSRLQEHAAKAATTVDPTPCLRTERTRRYCQHAVGRTCNDVGHCRAVTQKQLKYS